MNEARQTNLDEIREVQANLKEVKDAIAALKQQLEDIEEHDSQLK